VIALSRKNRAGCGITITFSFSGRSKSFVASALAQKACRDGYSALYMGAAALFRDLAIARADGSLRLLLAKFIASMSWSSMIWQWRR